MAFGDVTKTDDAERDGDYWEPFPGPVRTLPFVWRPPPPIVYEKCWELSYWSFVLVSGGGLAWSSSYAAYSTKDLEIVKMCKCYPLGETPDPQGGGGSTNGWTEPAVGSLPDLAPGQSQRMSGWVVQGKDICRPPDSEGGASLPPWWDPCRCEGGGRVKLDDIGPQRARRVFRRALNRAIGDAVWESEGSCC